MLRSFGSRRPNFLVRSNVPVVAVVRSEYVGQPLPSGTVKNTGSRSLADARGSVTLRKGSTEQYFTDPSGRGSATGPGYGAVHGEFELFHSP